MKMTWRKMVVACAFALTVSPLTAAEAMPRSEWHNLVSDCAQNAQTLSETMGKVAAADQVALLAEVNEAISKMPGSEEVKGAMFYAANSAAVKSAAKGNLPNVLAEVFATVPPEFLTDINERFAKEIFNRNANAGRTFTDAEYVDLTTNAVAVINARCEKGAANAGVRETFAILMFLRASNGTPANLSDALVAMLPDANTRELASTEWIKAAMGDGREQSYDPMLGVAQAGEEPNHAIVTTITGPANAMVNLLGELNGSNSPLATPTFNQGGVIVSGPLMLDAAPDIGFTRIPRAYAPTSEKRGDGVPGEREFREPDSGRDGTGGSGSGGGSGGGGGPYGPGSESGGYPGQ